MLRSGAGAVGCAADAGADGAERPLLELVEEIEANATLPREQLLDHVYVKGGAVTSQDGTMVCFDPPAFLWVVS